MSIFDGIILGIVQGLTEFIPVSSSGHLVLAQYALGLQASHAFEVVINLGTFLALLIYFRQRLWGLARRILIERDYRLARNILLTALPVGALGFLFGDFLDHPILQSAWVVAFMLIAVGIVMILLEKLPRASKLQNADELTTKRAGFIGVAQCLALIPGTSRSASTMIAGRIAGLTYKQAAEYSFLVSIPVMAGVVLQSFLGSEYREFIANHFTVWAVSNLAALISGVLAVSFMLRFLTRGNFALFGYYRIGLAVVVIMVMLL